MHRNRVLLPAILITALIATVSLPATAAKLTDYMLHLSTGDRQATPASTAEFFRASHTSPYEERGAIIQFYQLPDENTRRQLEAIGVRLYQYLPDRAFLASIPRTVQESQLTSAGVRWVGSLQPDDKIAEPLRLAGSPKATRNERGSPQFSVMVFRHVDLKDAEQWLATEYGAEIIGQSRLGHSVDIVLPADNWSDLAHDERVLWIEPFWPRRECNNSNRANTSADIVQAPPYNIDGALAVVGEWDGGSVDITHTDFGGRVVKGDISSTGNHATHCAGSVLGSGAQSGGTYRGMAPAASMVSYLWWSSASGLEDDYQDAIDIYGMDVTTNSWIVGYAPTSIEICEAFLGNYFAECSNLDDIISGGLGKTVAVAWAAGNERSGGSNYCGKFGMTFGTVAPYGTAKNTITIGAINSNNSSMTSFSSWGPVDDGRIKPELVAPGCQTSSDYGVTSTRAGGGYTVMCGTSMATPTAAGCFALWYDRYKELYPGQVPLASTIKAAYIQGADDIGDPGPEYDFGWGKINAAAAIDVLNAGAFFEDEITDGDTLSWTFAYDGSDPELSVTVAWDDPGAAPEAAPALINDIDVRVLTAQPFPTTLRPWHIDPGNPSYNATIGEDHTNNVEQVWKDTEFLGGGIWTLQIIGYNIPQGPQKFSVAFNPGLVMTPEQADYAAVFLPDGDISVIPGDNPIAFHVFNTGREDDTYDVTFASARGWTVTPNPGAVFVAGRQDSIVEFTHSIPVGTPPGNADTVVATFVSQTDPGITGEATVIVTVVAGYGVSVAALDDTVAVPERTVVFDANIVNLGTRPDTFDWSVSDNQGWTIVPSGGVLALPLAGDTTMTLAATVAAGATPGSTNNISVTATSQTDPDASGHSTTSIGVLAFPPLPDQVTFRNGELTSDNQPELIWTLGSYAPPPPGFDVFNFSLEIGDDTTLASGAVRYDGLTDTSFTPPAPLPDGPYFWRVISYNNEGDSSGFSASARFDIDATRPDAPALLSPPPNGAGTDQMPLFEWGTVYAKTAQAGDVTYRWEMSADSSFSDIDWYWTTTNAYYQLPITHKLEPCSTAVYWRVTATDPAGNISDPGGPSRYEVYIAGDILRDCVVDPLDLSGMIDYIFKGIEPTFPPERAEVNCIPGIDALDMSYLIDYLFAGGPPPCVEE